MSTVNCAYVFDHHYIIIIIERNCHVPIIMRVVRGVWFSNTKDNRWNETGVSVCGPYASCCEFPINSISTKMNNDRQRAKLTSFRDWQFDDFTRRLLRLCVNTIAVDQNRCIFYLFSITQKFSFTQFFYVETVLFIEIYNHIIYTYWQILQY